MTDHRTDHQSPAAVRAARAETRDTRPPAAWKRAARTISAPVGLDRGLPALLWAKGWRPSWGRYRLARDNDHLTAKPRRLH